jgi:medium-chain acyl-[acyl-carrier-protein] hydrolase
MHRRANILIRPFPRSAPRLRLFCFAHAGGGGSAYSRWSHELPDDVEVCGVQLPGRETRLRESPVTDPPELIDQLTTDLTPWLDRDFAFFGHSLGALLAFEVTRALRRRGAALPRLFFGSGYQSPMTPNGAGRYRGLSDDEMLAQIAARYGGIPSVVASDPDLRRHYIPVLRADFALLAAYQYAPEAPLDLPLFLYNGVSDARVTAQGLQGWRSLTTGPYQERWFPGGHFYLQENRTAVLQRLSQDLAFA